MNRTRTSWVVACALIWVLSNVDPGAAEIKPTPEEFLIPYATRKIDGPGDLSARVALAWDDEHLFLAARRVAPRPLSSASATTP
ncbi:MAG: hypothetical protein ACYTG0_03115 [Planctomycetota bacterium]|jgi:hypothetical protein